MQVRPATVAMPEAAWLALLESDTARARLQLYQRLLYSGVIAGLVFERARAESASIARATLGWIRSIDERQLAVERAARVRNLSRHLERACPTLGAFLGAPAHREWVARFADDDRFWQARGRTLGENYCLFVAPRLADPLLASLARLDGTLSGLPASPGGPSPWTGEPTPPALEGTIATEIFRSPVRLLLPDGAMPAVADRAGAGEPLERTIAVALLANRSRVVLALDEP